MSFFGGNFFGGGFFGGDSPQPSYDPPKGGPGGSNKAGKKKHDWERRGHVISAIQTPPEWYYDVLPEDTPVQAAVNDEVEALIEEQSLKIETLAQLQKTITEAIHNLETQPLYTPDESLKEIRRLQFEQYQREVEDNYRRLQRRRREEEAIIHILMAL